MQNARAYRALAETNRELREARDQLVEAERLAAIGELSAAVAHGIRNPVAGIKTAAELARRATPAPDDPLRESFVDILTEADALDSRISELLDFARPFAPQLRARRPERGRARLAAPAAPPDRRATASPSTPTLADGLPPHELDEAQIEQVVPRALHQRDRGDAGRRHAHGRRPLATGRGEDGDRRRTVLELRVRDTGHGIPRRQLPKIFRLFYTRKARGTGVGLATVKRIVDGHHGRIEVEQRGKARGPSSACSCRCDPTEHACRTRRRVSASAGERVAGHVDRGTGPDSFSPTSLVPGGAWSPGAASKSAVERSMRMP